MKKNIEKKKKNNKLKLFCLLLVVFLLEDNHKKIINENAVVLPTALPQENLWSIPESWEIFEKSIDPELPEIYNEQLLVTLISQAWQWDKNAMIQYARIEWMAHDKCFIRNFHRKNAHRILDRYGFRLKRPEIFDMNYSEFILKLAELRYPLAANLATGKIRGNAGTAYFKHEPLDPENHANLVKYKRYAINGGYHEHSYLADDILFLSSFSFKDPGRGELNSLKDRIPTLTQQELTESFEAYKVSALHNSQYAQIRISEFYFYGAGVEQDLERAWAWALVARNNFVEFQKKYAGKKHNRQREEDKYNDYNLDMMSKMDKKHLSKAQQENGAALVAEIKASIVTEDYYQWESEMEPIPPMP